MIENVNILKFKGLTTREKIAAAKASLKAKGLIHNPILGWAKVDEINKCIKEKIITYKNGYYCIPMEQKTIIVGRVATKEWVVAKRYYDYMIKTGRLKEDAVY